MGTGSVDNSSSSNNDGGTTGNNSTSSLSGEIDNTFFGISSGANLTEIRKAEMRTKYLNAGFTLFDFEGLWANQELFSQVDEFLNVRAVNGVFNSIDVKAVKNSMVLDVIRTFLDKTTLSQNEKYKALHDYIDNLNFNDVVSGGNSNGNSGSDPRLDLQELLSNPNFLRLTTENLRQRVKQFNGNLPDWQVNISAGVALENAYAQFSGYSKGWNMMATINRFPYLRLTRPDFIHNTYHTEANGEEIKFALGGIIEVKAPAGPITLGTNKNQILAEISFAQYARILNTYAYEKKAGAYTLVVPYGTVIDPEVEKECTKSGVNFYISYAFINSEGKVVFSNPKRQNFISTEKSPQPGNLDKPIAFDFQRATVYWDTSNNSEDE